MWLIFLKKKKRERGIQVISRPYAFFKHWLEKVGTVIREKFNQVVIL